MKTFREYLEEAEMDPRTALQIFGLADFPKTESELKQLYKKLAMQNHPDRGGSLEKMKDINLANEVLKRNIDRSIGNSYGGYEGVWFTSSGNGPERDIPWLIGRPSVSRFRDRMRIEVLIDAFEAE